MELIVILTMLGVVLLAIGTWPGLTEPKRKAPLPLRIPAVLCATPWQRWLERQAEIAEVRVVYEAPLYPPKGSGSGANTIVRRAPDGRVMAAPGTVRYRSGDGRVTKDLPAPDRPAPTRAVWR
jgi:hypothetical protein